MRCPLVSVPWRTTFAPASAATDGYTRTFHEVYGLGRYPVTLDRSNAMLLPEQVSEQVSWLTASPNSNHSFRMRTPVFAMRIPSGAATSLGQTMHPDEAHTHRRR